MLILSACLGVSRSQQPELIASSTPPVAPNPPKAQPTFTIPAETFPSQIAETAPPTKAAVEPKASPSVTQTPTANAIKATPTPREIKNKETPSPIDGLILASISGDGTFFIVRNGKKETIDRYTVALQLNGSNYPAPFYRQAVYKESTVFAIVQNQLFELKKEQTNLIYDDRIVSSLYGIIDDWIIVGTLGHNEERTNYLGSLSAVSIDGAEHKFIKQGQSGTTPVIDSIRGRVIYNDGEQVIAWYPDGTIQSLPLHPFRSGAISPDGRYGAFTSSNQTEIYDLDTNELLFISSFEVMEGDGFNIPIWSPQGDKVSFAIAYSERHYPFSIRVITMADGFVQDVNGASNHAFKPDGSQLVVYQVSTENEPGLALFDLNTLERTNLSIKRGSSIPAGWIDLGQKEKPELIDHIQDS